MSATTIVQITLKKGEFISALNIGTACTMRGCKQHCNSCTPRLCQGDS